MFMMFNLHSYFSYKALLWWVDLAGHQVTTKTLSHSPPQQERAGENKMEKTHRSRQGQFNKVKTKVTYGSKGKQMIYYLLLISRMSSHSMGRTVSVRVEVALEDKYRK